MITSKRHPIKFYLGLGILLMMLCGLGFLMVYMFVGLYSEGKLKASDYVILLLGLTLLWMAFYTTRQFFKASPKITVDETSILFPGEKYKLADIKKIKLTGKVPFKLLFNIPTEGISLTFKDGTQKYLYDGMYANTWQIKLFLEKVVIKKQDWQESSISKVDSKLLKHEHIDIFKGTQLTSLRGLSLWGIIGFFVYLPILHEPSPTTEGVIFFVVFSVLWFLYGSWLMHYFGLSKEYFIVRNHNLLWRKQIYRYTDIKEVVFETQLRMPHCLRVTTKDYRNKLYPAGTLRDKTWMALMRELGRKGVKVRNECI